MELSVNISLPQQSIMGAVGGIPGDGTECPKAGGEISPCFSQLFEKFTATADLSQTRDNPSQQPSVVEMNTPMLQRRPILEKQGTVPCFIAEGDLPGVLQPEVRLEDEGEAGALPAGKGVDAEVDSADHPEEKGEIVTLPAAPHGAQPPVAVICPMAVDVMKAADVAKSADAAKSVVEAVPLSAKRDALPIAPMGGGYEPAKPAVGGEAEPSSAAGNDSPLIIRAEKTAGKREAKPSEAGEVPVADPGREGGIPSFKDVTPERYRMQVIAMVPPGERGEVEKAVVKVGELPVQRASGVDPEADIFPVADPGRERGIPSFKDVTPERYRLQVTSMVPPGERGEVEKTAVKVGELPVQRSAAADPEVGKPLPGVSWGEGVDPTTQSGVEAVATRRLSAPSMAELPTAKSGGEEKKVDPGENGKGVERAGNDRAGSVEKAVKEETAAPDVVSWARAPKAGDPPAAAKAVPQSAPLKSEEVLPILQETAKATDRLQEEKPVETVSAGDVGMIARKAYGGPRESGEELKSGNSDTPAIRPSGNEVVTAKVEGKAELQTEDARQTFAERIHHQVREKLESGNYRTDRSSITLQLHPQELGELKINLRMEEQRLRVEVVTENQSVKEALMQNLDSLKETLSRQNIAMDRFHVSTDIRHDFHQGARDGNRAMQDGRGYYGHINPAGAEENVPLTPLYGWESDDSTMSLVL